MKAKSRPSPNRAVRGGSWWNDAREARVAHCDVSDPSLRGDDLGFRLVRRVS